MKTPAIWTGIGSRDIPDDVSAHMIRFGRMMASTGAIFRSGKAIGSDEAFQVGHESWYRENDTHLDNMEIYIIPDPRDKRTSISSACDINGMTTPMWETFCLKKCKEIHPAGNKLKGYALLLHARNILQVVGEMCDHPSDFCIYYAREDNFGKLIGGTATAANYCRELNIPSYNICTDKGDENVRKLWKSCTN